MPAFKEEELIMTKKNESNDKFQPLSAVETTITTMGINEDGEFLRETNPIENGTDQSELVDAPERNPADIAADFANKFLMHRHRGVINCDSYFVIFGNDGYSSDQRSRIESSEVWRKLRHHDPVSGMSSDGVTWSLVLTDHSRSLFDEDELNQLVWDTWMEVCDRYGQKPSEIDKPAGVISDDSN